MKKLLFFIMASLCLMKANAESIVRGDKTFIPQDEAKIISENFSSYEVISVDISKFKQDVRNKTKEFILDLGTDLLQNIKISMEENEIRSVNFQSYVSNGKFRIYPNPATDIINIAFEKIETADDLPDAIELFDESSSIAIKSIQPKELYNKKQLTDKIEIDVKDLKRGTYFLHVRTDKNKEKPKEILRVILD